jgi:lipopolysaccharide/colanic/teichoic acid biosynthesis glycosyltransferase
MIPATVLRREITVRNDPRVTPVGRVLRATKLDELPQLVNVLRGEMSLVGPRPESPRYVAHYTSHQRAVLAVRPGITGPAQIVYCHEERLLGGRDPELQYLTVVMPAKLALDLDYVRHHSLRRDVGIVVRTLFALIRSPLPLPAARVTARSPAHDDPSNAAAASSAQPGAPRDHAQRQPEGSTAHVGYVRERATG